MELSVCQQRNTLRLFSPTMPGLGMFFCELMDCKILRKDFLKRSAKGKGKVEAVINTEKQFGITYFLEKEEITFEVWGREYEID